MRTRASASREFDFECSACGARRRGIATGTGLGHTPESARRFAERNIDEEALSAVRCPQCRVLPARAVWRWWWKNTRWFFFFLGLFALAAAAPALLDPKNGLTVSVWAGVMYGVMFLPALILLVRAWLDAKKRITWL